jgi:hypothetical protein
MPAPIIPILTGAGALLGGIKGYQEGGLGGVIPGALTGGAVTGLGAGATRMAGSKLLGKTALGKTVLDKAAKGIPLSGLEQAVLAAPAAAATGVAGLSALTGGFGAAGPSGRVAGDLVKGASQVAGAGMALNTMIDPNTGVVYQTPAVPGNLPKPYNVGDVVNPTEYFAAQRLNEKLLQDLALRGTKEAAAFQLPEIDRIKQRDLQRELTARKIATDLQTAQTMMLQGQLGAQALGQNTLQNIGAAARTQYRYL